MNNVEQDTPWAKDCMDRQRVANFLTRHLDNSPHIKVLNVNSGWGSGKTFFVTEWQNELKMNRVCVYFDAWKHDYTGDPFVSLVATIKDQLEAQVENTAAAKSHLNDFAKKAAKTLLAATPVIAKGLVKKLSSIDIDKISEATENSDAGDKEAGEIESEAAEKAVEYLINSKKEALKSVEDFKAVFNKLLSEAVSQKPGVALPAYIFIDELDRCRPTFAIELLERIKHLFDIKECKFIIASDTLQLGHSITAIYGQGFEAQKYLKRFFDAEFELDNSNMVNWVVAKYPSGARSPHESIKLPLISATNNSGFGRRDMTVPIDQDTLVQDNENKLSPRQLILLALINTFDPKLRELEKLIGQINAFEENCDANSFQFFWAAYLLFLKDADSELYRQEIRDKKEGLIKIESKFKGCKIYFGDSNPSVHEVANYYMISMKLGEKEIARRMNNGSAGHQYADAIRHNCLTYYNQLAGYPLLVDLAHRLD